MTQVRTRSSFLIRFVRFGLAFAVELAWLGAWSSALGPWLGSGTTAPLLSGIVLVVVALLAIGASRLLPPGSQLAARQRIAVGAIGMVVGVVVAADILASGGGVATWGELLARLTDTIVGLRAIAAMGLIVLTWWRGIVVARNRLTIDDVESGMQTAIALLALLFVVSALVGQSSAAPVGPSIESALVVIFCGLVGLPLARVANRAAGARARDEPSPGINRQWLAMLVGTVSFLLVIVIVLAALFTFQRIDQLAGLIFGPLSKLLDLIVYAIALPIGYVVQAIVSLLQLLIHPTQPPPVLQLPGNPLDQLQRQAEQTNGPPLLLVLVVRWTIVGLVAAGVLYLLARAAFRHADDVTTDGVEEERDFVWSWSDFWSAIWTWLGGLRRKVEGPTRLRTSPSEVEPGAWSTSRDPRALYRELIRLGARLGRRRLASETPLEYERALDGLAVLAASEPDLRTVTEVYVDARYGNDAPDDDRVTAAVEGLVRLRATALGLTPAIDASDDEAHRTDRQ